MLGTPQNAGLICGLYGLRAGVDPELSFTVHLGNPVIGTRPAGREDPEFALQRLWQLGPTTAAAGYWHELAYPDFITYSLIRALAVDPLAVSWDARRLLRAHPVWPALRFLPGVNFDAACRLVAELVDPRWFSHATRPGRLSRLYAFCGATPSGIQAYLQGLPRGRHRGRLNLVMETWFVGSQHAPDLASPASFLWRICRHHGSGVAGLLRATKRFLRFLHDSWSDELCQTWQDVSLLSGFFGTRTREAEHYAMHRAKVKAESRNRE